jgi:7,8-dihydroneopterin aldolase/epimerase/oxygenase
MDIIFLGGLAIDTIIGIYDWERNTKQTVVLDIEMAYDISKAAETDGIEFTLDYKKISERIIDFVENSQFLLVETLVVEIANMLLKEFNIPWVKITLNKKGAIPQASHVGITIERGQK